MPFADRVVLSVVAVSVQDILAPSFWISSEQRIILLQRSWTNIGGCFQHLLTNSFSSSCSLWKSLARIEWFICFACEASLTMF